MIPHKLENYALLLDPSHRCVGNRPREDAYQLRKELTPASRPPLPESQVHHHVTHGPLIVIHSPLMKERRQDQKYPEIAAPQNGAGSK